MKNAVVLCLLAVLCTVDATLLNLLLIRVRNAKWNVESTIRQLEHLRGNVEQQTDLTIMQKWLEQMEKHRDYVNPTLVEIKKNVEVAKAEGKGAQPCYDTALNIIKNIDYAAYVGARRCQESAKSCIRSNLGFIDNLVSTGHGLITELDNIFPNCYGSVSGIIDIIKLRSCITSQLGISNVGVKNLQRDANSARYTSKTASDIVIRQGTSCINNAYMNARTYITEARSAAARCLKAL